MFETYGWSDIYQSGNAPYLNQVIARSDASYATQYFKPAPTGGLSEPQYIWLEAGDWTLPLGSGTVTFSTDNDPSPSNSTDTTSHLVTLLKNAGVPWKGYFEGITGSGCPTSDVNNYAVRHNAWMFFQDVTNNTAYCQAHNRPYSELASDLTAGTVSGYNLVIPNTCNDMHDSCSPLNNPVLQGDTWLSNNLPTILNSNAYKNGGLVIITDDNDDNNSPNGGNGAPLPMIILSPDAKGGGYNNSIFYNHSSALRTVEEIFGVSPLLRNAATATDLSDLFKSSVYSLGRRQ